MPERSADRVSLEAGFPDHGVEVRTLRIGVLTYRRPDVLAVTLPVVIAHVRAAATRFGVQAGVLVIDNDPAGSARTVVTDLGGVPADGGPEPAEGALPLLAYLSEPVPGISAARNRALADAGTDLLVFLDDDEEPRSGWLDTLLSTHRDTKAAVVCGKVDAVFAGELDPWIAAGEFFRRFSMPTGTVIHTAAAGNLLLDLRQVRPTHIMFERRFGLSGGEDTLFSRRLDRCGLPMVWCEESVATDHVPADRMTRRWVLVRSFSHGNTHSLVDLELAAAGRERLLAVVRAWTLGGGRVVIGSVRYLVGLALGSNRHQARGARTACRGSGMMLAGLGLCYQEYARSGWPLRRVRGLGPGTGRLRGSGRAKGAQGAIDVDRSAAA